MHYPERPFFHSARLPKTHSIIFEKPATHRILLKSLFGAIDLISVTRSLGGGVRGYSNVCTPEFPESLVLDSWSRTTLGLGFGLEIQGCSRLGLGLVIMFCAGLASEWAINYSFLRVKRDNQTRNTEIFVLRLVSDSVSDSIFISGSDSDSASVSYFRLKQSQTLNRVSKIGTRETLLHNLSSLM